jgi:hypothetical protein
MCALEPDRATRMLVESHMREHHRQEHVGAASERRHGQGAPFQILDRADPARAEQLVAADVAPRHDHDRLPGVDAKDEVRAEAEAEVPVAGGQDFRARLREDVLDVAEALGVQELLGHELRCEAEGATAYQSDPRNLGRRLGVSVSRTKAQECTVRERQEPREQHAPAHTAHPSAPARTPGTSDGRCPGR